jgi:hypothetical protein
VVLAKFDFGQAVAVFIFLVLPLLQSAYQKLQKKRAEAEAKERMRRRREGTLPNAEQEPATKRGLLARLEDLVNEADGDRLGDARTQAEDERRAAEVERPWDELPEFRGTTDRSVDDEDDADDEPRPRTVAPAQPAAARAAVTQISDYEATGRGGLAAMGPVPTEDEVEAGRLEATALVELEGFDGIDAMEPLVDLPGLGSSMAIEAAAETGARRRAPRRAGGLASGGGWRRAVVLSEVLGPPVAMRKGGGYAPGLDPDLGVTH